jgi:ribosomal protein S18 acetylase RimI-like enzyme
MTFSPDIEMICPTSRHHVVWPSRFTVRTPIQADVPILAELDNEGLTPQEIMDIPYPDSVQRYFAFIPTRTDTQLSLRASSVVLLNNAIIAYCLFTAEPGDVAGLYNIHVAEPHRRCGIATRMVQHGFTVLADTHAHVALDTDTREKAYLLFKKLGFVEKTT